MPLEYNELKRETLAAFANLGPLSPPEWATQVGFYPIRASYSYLSRLRRWGLLLRSQDGRGRILYRLSVRGEARLAWLIDRARKRR